MNYLVCQEHTLKAHIKTHSKMHILCVSGNNTGICVQDPGNLTDTLGNCSWTAVSELCTGNRHSAKLVYLSTASIILTYTLHVFFCSCRDWWCRRRRRWLRWIQHLHPPSNASNIYDSHKSWVKCSPCNFHLVIPSSGQYFLWDKNMTLSSFFSYILAVNNFTVNTFNLSFHFRWWK